MLLSLTRVSSSNSELLELLRSIVGRKGHYYNFMYIYFFIVYFPVQGRCIYIYIYYALPISISNALHTYCTHVDKYEQALVVPANIFY